jgi:hypothetical protein
VKAYLIPLLVLCSCGSGDPQLEALEQAHDLVLPSDPVIADILVIEYPPRLQSLMTRMVEGMREHPIWTMAYIAEHSEPGMLPFHKNFGITEAEYQEIVDGFSNLTNRKVGEADLWFEALSGQRVRLHSRSLATVIGGIEVDFAEDCAHTQYGKADDRGEIGHDEESEDAKSPFGKPVMGEWSGIRWKNEVGLIGALVQAQVKVSLGKMEDDGRGVFVYRVRNGDANKGGESIELFLVYGSTEQG